MSKKLSKTSQIQNLWKHDFFIGKILAFFCVKWKTLKIYCVSIRKLNVLKLEEKNIV